MSCRKSENKWEKNMYKLSKGNLKCHFVIISKPRSGALAFSSNTCTSIPLALKLQLYGTLYLNSWPQTSYVTHMIEWFSKIGPSCLTFTRYELHFKMLKSKLFNINYHAEDRLIFVTRFLVWYMTVKTCDWSF